MLSRFRVVLLLMLAFALSACATSQERPPSPPSEEETPDLILKDVEFVEYQGPKPGYVVLAAEASLIEDEDRLFLKEVRIREIKPTQNGLYVRGDWGWYDLKEGRLFLEGSVVIKTRNRGVLETQSLLYLSRQDELVGEKEVLIKGEGTTIRGIGFVYEIKKGRLKVCQKVELIGQDFI